jgi:hypothetical protein
MNSSDCVANEKECSDSLGKRLRSSPNANVGEAGAVGAASEGCLDPGGVAKFSDVDRAEGGPREPGCWRMRRRPDAPMPCSCSGTMGDLRAVSHDCQTQTRAGSVPAHTHLVMRSSWPASKLMRFAVSMASGVRDLSRLDVLLFLTSEAYSGVSW